MGFRLNREYVLQFEGTALEGAEIRFRSTPVSTMIKLRETKDQKEIAELISEYLVCWNLEDHEGKAVEATPEAILANIEHTVLIRIGVEWYRAAAGITAPLDPPSDDGSQSLEESIPMEPLSPSQTS